MRNLQPILLVEDDRVDVMTTKRSLRDVGIENEVVHSVNGEGALLYLKDERSKEPCIILLDLNMPRMDGMELLKTVKSDQKLRRIPVVILTTSKNESDVAESFELGAAGYMVKPADYEKFVATIRTIKDYWTVSELPNGS